MRGRFNLLNLDAIEASASITMTLGEWRRLRSSIDLMPVDAETYALRQLITNMIDHAERVFYATDPPPENG